MPRSEKRSPRVSGYLLLGAVILTLKVLIDNMPTQYTDETDLGQYINNSKNSLLEGHMAAFFIGYTLTAILDEKYFESNSNLSISGYLLLKFVIMIATYIADQRQFILIADRQLLNLDNSKSHLSPAKYDEFVTCLYGAQENMLSRSNHMGHFLAIGMVAISSTVYHGLELPIFQSLEEQKQQDRDGTECKPHSRTHTR